MPSQEQNRTRAVVVIPARWSSSRFPGKPLHLIAGKPLVQHVWERCVACESIDEIVVATDDERIARAVHDFGGVAVMTRETHPSGTDRMAEVLESHPNWAYLINVQGDEPLMSPHLIDQMVGLLQDHTDWDIVTAASPITDLATIQNPNVVKVVMDQQGRALYFSRSAIPYHRDTGAGWSALRHMGIYGYRAQFLQTFVTWPPSSLENAECLEQLRALENGARIGVTVTLDLSPGVDTLEQAHEVEKLILGQI